MNGKNDMASQAAAPRIVAVEPGDGDFVLRITWESGEVSRVDLTAPVFALKVLRPLRKMDRFAAVGVVDWGWAVSWGDGLEVSGERLWEMAREQSEAEMTPSEFRAWLDRFGLTQQTAADLLGISKRSVAYYTVGAQPVTRLLALALKGAETELAPQARGAGGGGRRRHATARARHSTAADSERTP